MSEKVEKATVETTKSASSEPMYRNMTGYIMMVKKGKEYHRVAPHGIIHLSEKPTIKGLERA